MFRLNIFKKDVDLKVLRFYMNSDKIYRHEGEIFNVANAAVNGGAETVEMIQKFHPEMTRERIRQVLAKISRVVKYAKESL